MKIKDFFSNIWNIYSLITGIVGVVLIFIPTIATKNINYTITLPIVAWLTLLYFLIASIVANIVFIIRSSSKKIYIESIQTTSASRGVEMNLYKIKVLIRNNSNQDVFVESFTYTDAKFWFPIQNNNIIIKNSITPIPLDLRIPVNNKSILLYFNLSNNIELSYEYKLPAF